jgi:DNA-binding transcriptional LysR family regulator
LQLTERGKALLPKIRELLRLYDELLGCLRGSEPLREVVRVGLGSFSAQLYLPPVLVEVNRQGRWGLETYLVRGRERIRGVAESWFDLALVTHYPEDVTSLSGLSTPAGSTPPLTAELLARYPLFVLAHPGTSAGAEMAGWPADQPLAMEKLLDWPLVGLDEQSGLHRKLRRQLKSGQALTLVAEGQPGGWALGREFARYQLGVAFLPLPFVTNQDRQDFVVRGLPASFAVEVYLVTRSGPLSPTQNEARDLFHRIAGRVGESATEPPPGKARP